MMFNLGIGNFMYHGNGRTFRDSFSTFKHIYHKDLVCENKSNVLLSLLCDSIS